MKNLFLLSSLLLGGSLAASNGHTNARKTFKHFRWGAAKPIGQVSILIDKTDYELSVYDDKGWYATYPVVFGNNGLDDKKMQGDKNTPEGVFHIAGKRVHDKWCRFMAIDYPTAESRQKFAQRKQKGEIPANASIGGGIGIHGTWPHDDAMIDRYMNWTEGCISMKNTDVMEVFSYTTPGTKVTIRY